MPSKNGRPKGAHTNNENNKLNIVSDGHWQPLQTSGITLIALIITIILLLILAGVTIHFTLGENGILKNAEIAKEEYTKSQIREEIQLAVVDIIQENVSLGKEINNKKIQEGLQEKIAEIQEDLQGAYKGYNFEIDENYNVNVTNKDTEIMRISFNPQIGTGYITIIANASSKNGEITRYEYIIDENTYKSDKNSYTIENLEPESIHTIQVVAYDEKENKKETNKLTVKTEPRTYLYKYGDEYIEITGGWKEIYKTDWKDTAVSNTLTVDKSSGNHINIKVTGERNTCTGAAIGTEKRIDMTNYKYMCVTATATLGDYNSACICQINLESDEDILTGEPTGYGLSQGTICYIEPTNMETARQDYSEYNGLYSPAIYIQAHRTHKAEADIYEVWLEK